MSRLRVAIVGLVAVFAVSAIAASAETIREFYVNGAKVTASEKATLKFVGTSEMTATILGAKTIIACSSGSGEVTLEKEGKNKAKTEFTNCVVKEESGKELTNCKVLTPITSILKGHLEKPEGTEPMLDLLEASEPPVITTITIEGANCAVKESNGQVTGKQKCELPKAEEEKETHEILCKPAGSSSSTPLEFMGKPATLKSTEEATIAGKTFSAK